MEAVGVFVQNIEQNWDEFDARETASECGDGVAWCAEGCVGTLNKATEAAALGKVCKVFKVTFKLLQEFAHCLASSHSACSEACSAMADRLEPLVRGTEGFVSALGAFKLFSSDLPGLIRKNAEGDYLIGKKNISEVIHQVGLTSAHAIDFCVFFDNVTGLVGALSAANSAIGAAVDFLPPAKIIRSIVMIPVGITGIINNVNDMIKAYQKKDLLEEKHDVWQKRAEWISGDQDQAERKVQQHYQSRAKLNAFRAYIEYTECERLLDKKIELYQEARVGNLNGLRVNNQEGVDPYLEYSKAVVEAFYKISKKHREENNNVVDWILAGNLDELRVFAQNNGDDADLKDEVSKAVEEFENLQNNGNVAADYQVATQVRNQIKGNGITYCLEQSRFIDNLHELKTRVRNNNGVLNGALTTRENSEAFTRSCDRKRIDRKRFDGHIAGQIKEAARIERKLERACYLAQANAVNNLVRTIFDNKVAHYKKGGELEAAQKDVNTAALGMTFSAVMLASGVASLVVFFAGIAVPWIAVTVAVGFAVGAIFDLAFKLYPKLHKVDNTKWSASSQLNLRDFGRPDDVIVNPFAHAD